MQRSKETSAEVIASHSKGASAVERSSFYEELEHELKCPSCHSEIAFFILSCQNCNSVKVKSGIVLEHVACKYYDFNENFKTSSGQVVCPKCGKSSTGRAVEFLSRGYHYKCLGCSTFIEEPKILFSCSTCGYSGKTNHELPSLNIALHNANELKEQAYVRASNILSLIENINSRNWYAIPFGSLLGRSGVDQAFSLIASKHPLDAKSSRGHVLVVELVASSKNVGENKMLIFFAKALDAGVKDKILVAVPKLELRAKKFADSYGIATVEALTPELALDSLSKKITELIEKGGREQEIEKPRSAKRTSFDIIADILTIAEKPISKTEILYRANLSFKQAEKYLKMLDQMGLLKAYFENGATRRFLTTQKGTEYLSNSFSQFGRITSGSSSVWGSRKSPEIL